VSWFSLVIGQNASRQLATSSENLVASAQFLVALATSESQFRTLLPVMGSVILGNRYGPHSRGKLQSSDDKTQTQE